MQYPKIAALINISLLMLFAAQEIVYANASNAPSTPLLQVPLRKMHLFQSGAGWITAGNQILWTNDWGNNWADITPSLKNVSVDGAFFLPNSTGWLIVHNEASPPMISIAMTNDRGKTWTTVPLSTADTMVREGYSGQTAVSFADELHGWILLKKMSGAASSLGDLFATTDGGKTWSHLPGPPVAGQILFTSVKNGWLVGGPRNDDLFITTDGAGEWQKAIIPAPKGSEDSIEVHFGLPYFSDSRHALLSAKYLNANKTITAVIYSSDDAGETWKIVRQYAGLSVLQRIAIGFEDSHAIAAAMNHNNLTIWDNDGNPHSMVLPYSSAGVYSVSDIQFGDALHGWLHIVGAECASAKTNCSSRTALLKTSDGGSSFAPLLDHVTAEPQAVTIPTRRLAITSTAVSSGLPSNRRLSPVHPDTAMANVNTYGIDSCRTMYQEGTDELWDTTANTSLGFYLGGETANAAGCYQPNSTGLYLIACRPWSYMPIWDGLQAPCATGLSQHIDPATAATQGASAADQAAAKLNSLGLYNSIGYLDIEAYPRGDAGCSQAVKDYVNSYVSQMHNNGFMAGVYANGANIWDDLTREK
jgi:photosystem II stability/assembly factor-like uncharacterized protein